MAHVFDVTAGSETVALDGSGAGEVSITVTNVTSSTTKGRAVLGPPKAPELAWLRLVGDPERAFPPNGTQTFTVKVAVPPGTQPGEHGFRLDAVSVEHPDEDFTQGPTVGISIALAPPPPKPFPWWIIAVVVVVLVVGAGAILLLRPDHTVPVVDVKTKTLSEASRLLAQGQLKVGSIRLVLGEQKDVDLVLRQDPPAPGKATPETAVNLDVGIAIQPVPGLINKTLGDAQKALSEAHLELGAVTQVNRPGVTVAGLVLDASPKDGMVKSHDRIDLTVQQGNVQVPALTGHVLAEAQAMLAIANLTLGSASGLPWVLGVNGLQALIIDQAPRPGETVPIGSKVNIVFPGIRRPLDRLLLDSIRREALISR